MRTANPPKPAPPAPLDPARQELAYILPMAVFIGFTVVGSHLPSTFPVVYAMKTIAAAAVLLAMRRYYTSISWSHLGLGAIVGIVGVVQWIGTEKLLLHLWPNYPRMTGEPFIPHEHLAGPMLWAFLAVRWLGPTLVVPFMEELFWRDWLWRRWIAPADFQLAKVGEWDRGAFIGVALLFAAVHMQMWITAIGYGLLIGLLLVRTKSLGACIVAHGITNFLLGAYVLAARDWMFW